MRMSFVFLSAFAACAAHGAAIMECGGLVTGDTEGWRFEASDAKCGERFNPLEGWYPDKGGKLISPRIAIPRSGAYYKLSFTGFAPVRSYATVAFYDAAGNMIADNYDVIYGSGEVGEKSSGSGKYEKFHSSTSTQNFNSQRYERIVFAQEGVKEVEIFFQSTKGCTVKDVKFEPASVEEAAAWCDGVYAKLPPLNFSVPGELVTLPPRTLDALKTGKPWRILMLGDSIMQDTFHSQFHALVKRAYPKSDATWLVSVRGSTGCWYYCEPENFMRYVAAYKPDCVFIGGISGWIHPEMPLNGGPAIESVAKRIGSELGAEVVVMTPSLAIDLRVPKGTEAGSAVTSMEFNHASLGDKAWKYDVAAAEELKTICAKNGWPLWDMFTPAYDWLFKTGLPSEFYSRDYVHSGELGKQIIGRIALAYFTAANGNGDMSADAIVNGVHGYMPDDYVEPKEPEVRERLEWFKDQKLALMMHFGMYSQMGVYESWPLSDADSSWSRVQIDWTEDAEEFKRQYWNLWKSFNPVRFQPKKWARLAKDNGFRYLIFTTKHHDGFCLFDTRYTDFKVTNPGCPFSKDPRADIVRNVFDAFRAEGLGIAAYFSKPDWHSEDYWENRGMGRTVSRMPTYDVKANPEKWAKFREFTKNQIVELVRDYGPVDVIWLDGGQVQRKTGLDIGIEDIIAEARKYKKDLISADRTAGGACENVITPEQTVPPEPLAVPWESCITMGTGFSYRYDDEFKSPRELVHLLLDVVAKGGNLALNVAPGPDGRLPQPAIERMEALGAWLKANGAGVYATRPAAPFSKGKWRFTGSKDAKTLYAFRLWSNGEHDLLSQTIPVENRKNVTSIRHLGTGVDIRFRVEKDGLVIRLPETFRTDHYADGFALSIQ